MLIKLVFGLRQLSSAKRRRNRRHGILEFACLIIHDRLATKSFDVLDVLRAGDANYLQACIHRELNRIRSDISSGSENHHSLIRFRVPILKKHLPGGNRNHGS